MNWSFRTAVPSDVPALRALIHRSATELQRDTYTSAQIQVAMGPVFGVDEQMIADGTYFVVEDPKSGAFAGCGGWSFRLALFGGRDADAGEEPERLNPETDAARIRAFFVDPAFARQGVGSLIMEQCEEAIISHGFRRGEISATLVGEPLYRKFGYETVEYYEILLQGAPPLRVARMAKGYHLP